MDKFVPASSKLEAVARISSLTNSGPEQLGPGSKERKSVVTNLAIGLNLGINVEGTKQQVAAETAKALGAKWTDECESVGQTLTLSGLNLLLQSATEFFDAQQKNSSHVELSVSEEAQQISSVITDELSKNAQNVWNGKECVKEMKDAGSSQWRQTEWQGFYFEFKALPALITKLGGGPVKIQNTKFDYQLKNVWDLKAHSIHGSQGPKKQNHQSQLNDKLSMDTAIANGGLGLIVLSGIPSYAGMEFTLWHKELRGGGPEEPRRMLKNAFTPTYLDAFFIPTNSALVQGLSEKMIVEFKQGKQQSGAARPPKYTIDLMRCRGSSLQIFGASLR